MKSLTDCYRLSNGVEIPCIGFGTWQTPDGDVCVSSVKAAIEAGYRHIDTAEMYGNEDSVGKAIKESGIDRKELFITSKLSNQAHGYEKTMEAFEGTMEKLGLDYLDMFLIHWPNPIAFRDHWQEANAGSWNQMKLCPGETQEEVVDYCRSKGMLLEAYSPLGIGQIFQVPEMQELADKYGRSIAQICIRWSLQRGYLPLPKSVTPSRIQENARVFDFELEEADVRLIANLKGCVGYAADPDTRTF